VSKCARCRADAGRAIADFNRSRRISDYLHAGAKVYPTGMTNTNSKQIALTVLCWLGRIGTVVVFLFWGAFFLEHLMEWFVKPFPQTPPARVWLGQALHFLMLAGLLVALRWPQVGSPVVVVAAGIFLTRAGPNFPLFFAATILPVLVLLGCWWARHKAASLPPVIP